MIVSQTASPERFTIRAKNDPGPGFETVGFAGLIYEGVLPMALIAFLQADTGDRQLWVKSGGSIKLAASNESDDEQSGSLEAPNTAASRIKNRYTMIINLSPLKILEVSIG